MITDDWKSHFDEINDNDGSRERRPQNTNRSDYGNNQERNYGRSDNQTGYNRSQSNYDRPARSSYDHSNSFDEGARKRRPRVGEAPMPLRNTNMDNRGGYRNDYQDGYNNRGDRGSYRNDNNQGYRDNRNFRNNSQGQDGYSSQRQTGGYNNNRQGGYNNQGQDGGYNSQRQGGYNNRQGGYNNQGYSGGGGYNNNRQGGYNNNQGGYQQRPQQGRGNYSQNSRPNQNRNAGGYNNNGYSQQRNNNYNTNINYGQQKQLKYREENFDPNEAIRLNKYLANAGVCSRREADEFIKAGVVKVNGETVSELGAKVKRADLVTFHDQPVKLEHKVYILLNKPKNCVTTADDPQERLTVMDLVKNACHERIFPVGRLDRNTTGVLLLTNDGDLSSKLTHPKFLKKKIYHVWLDKDVTISDMQKLADGIELEDGEIHADAISYVTDEAKDQVGIEIHSGRNRIVRRMFETLGYHVIKLDRVYFAGLTKKRLKRGQWRFLTEREVSMLRMGAFE